jgi:hypothetical protein
MLPGWARWTYGLLLALLLVAGAFVVFGSLPRYAEGPAIIRADAGGEPRHFSVVALAPGGQRGELRRGMPVTLELSGYSSVYQTAAIERVADQAVGPDEGRRILGREGVDGTDISGPVVVIHAALPGDGFVAGGRTLPYYDGMPAIARVKVGSERILTVLVPALRPITGRTP